MNLQNQSEFYSKRTLMSRLKTGLVGLALTSTVLASGYVYGSGHVNPKATPQPKIIKTTPLDKKLTFIDLNSKLAKASKLNKNPILQQIVLTNIFTHKVYDYKFNSIGNADEIVAKKLYSYDLDDLVSMKAISTNNENQKDLWLPLGLKNGQIDFYLGMKNCWNDKLQRYDSKLSSEQKNILIQERNESLSKIRKYTEKSSLRNYRDNEIGTGIKLLKELSTNYIAMTYNIKSDKKSNKKLDQKSDNKNIANILEMKRFISNLDSALTANVLLGYNIQEMLPPSLGEDKINAVAKAYFIDQLFSKGGKKFIERYPARYDIMLSYGPFQLTKYAMAEIVKKDLNSYVKNYRFPKKMADVNTLQDHVNLSVGLAFINWITLGNSLKSNNLLKKFNDGFDKMNTRERKIVYAGVTACMHHLPAGTRKGVINYVGHHKDMTNMHYGLLTYLSPQLQKYYRSSAESYLVMKVYHILDDRYSK